MFYLQVIPSVDEKGVERHPVAVMLNLKPSKLVLHQEGQKPMVCVCRKAHYKFRLRTWWVTVDNQQLGAQVYIHPFMYVVFFKP